ncbi:MAG: putative porin [Bacteroidales bacterium]
MYSFRYFIFLFFFFSIVQVNTIIAYEPLDELNNSEKADSCSLDSVKRTEVEWFNKEQLITPFKTAPNYIDTNITSLQQYDFAMAQGLFLAHKGNVGHASRNLVFNPLNADEFPLFNYNSHDGYMIINKDMRFIRPKHVFSELYYVVGSDTEQLFHARHAQKLDTNLYIGFGYRVINSPGMLSRMVARNTNLYGMLDYKTKNEKYQLISTFAYNRILNQESGGLKNREGFEDNDARDSVYLYQAELKKFDIDIHVNHFYSLGFKYSREQKNPDSEDSLNTDRKARHFNLGRIGHELKYRRRSFVFDEEAPVFPFYETEPYDEFSTYDSTVVSMLQNELSWSNFPLESKSFISTFNFKFYIKHQYISLKFPDYTDTGSVISDDIEDEEEYAFDKRAYSQLIPGVELQTDNSKFISLFGKANTTIGGYNDKDYAIRGGLKLGRPHDKHLLNFIVGFKDQEVPYFLNYYVSNYNRWGNKFGKIKTANASARYSFFGLSLEANYFILNNYVYMNEKIQPEQNGSTINTFNFCLKTDHNLWNFGLRNNIVFQYVPDSEFEDYPELISYHSLYYGSSLFNNALHFQIGLDLYYISSYYPAAYMPVMMQFYKQSDYNAEQKFLLDAFLNIKISDVRVFLKYQNLGGLLYQDSPQYHIPFYPLPDYAFKFGISWMFFN